MVDRNLLREFDVSEDDLTFTIPARRYGQRWTRALDTATPATDFGHDTALKPGDVITVMNHSVQVLHRV